MFSGWQAVVSLRPHEFLSHRLQNLFSVAYETGGSNIAVRDAGWRDGKPRGLEPDTANYLAGKQV